VTDIACDCVGPCDHDPAPNQCEAETQRGLVVGSSVPESLFPWRRCASIGSPRVLSSGIRAVLCDAHAGTIDAARSESPERNTDV
jgi:hypothetical protein